MAKSKKTSTEKIYLMRRAKGYSYHAGQVHEVPVKIAKDLKELGVARQPEETLPKDLPHREDLIKAGIETMDDVLSVDDFTKVPGIGKAGQKEVQDYLRK